MATGGGKQPTFRTVRAQRTVRPQRHTFWQTPLQCCGTLLQANSIPSHVLQNHRGIIQLTIST